ncbi:MAG: DUF503 domain-containing protein [Anaerolineales bacterium]
MHVGCLSLELRLPGCSSLKEKRSRLKPLLAGVHKKYNVSAAEIDHMDQHKAAVVACVIVSNDSQHVQRALARIPRWLESRFPDIMIVDDQFQFL